MATKSRLVECCRPTSRRDRILGCVADIAKFKVLAKTDSANKCKGGLTVRARRFTILPSLRTPIAKSSVAPGANHMQTPGLALNQVVTPRTRLPTPRLREIFDRFRLLIFLAVGAGVCPSSAVSTRLGPASLACPNITHNSSRR